MSLIVAKKWEKGGFILDEARYGLYWAGALVYWLREETHNQKVVSSNPGARYRMAIFNIIFLYNI